MRRSRPDIAAHLFKVGQTVRFTGGLRNQATKISDIYHVTATLPPRDDVLQYRIRNEDERHERVATQDNLEGIDRAQKGPASTLIERTFANG
jgi:hypothetical protein